MNLSFSFCDINAHCYENRELFLNKRIETRLIIGGEGSDLMEDEIKHINNRCRV